MRSIKVRAAREDRKLKDLIAELLRKGLATERDEGTRRRVTLPLIHTAHEAATGDELTPERVAQILIDEEVKWLT